MAYFRVELGVMVEKGYHLPLDKYPIFDETYREVLNNKIIDHYYTYEVGMNWGMFTRRLAVKMNEIMPLYNKMYLAEKELVNPFVTVDLTAESTTESVGNRDDETTATSTAKAVADEKSDSDSRALFSNTPQTQLSGKEDYATSLTDTVGTSKGTSATESDTESLTKYLGNDKNLTKFISSQKGFSGISKTSLFREYLDNLLNIDMMVIAELDSLFFGLYTPDIGYDDFGFFEQPQFSPFNEGWLS